MIGKNTLFSLVPKSDNMTRLGFSGGTELKGMLSKKSNRIWEREGRIEQFQEGLRKYTEARYLLVTPIGKPSYAWCYWLDG